MKNNSKNFKSLAGFWLMVFVVGGVAGVLLSQLFLPWLAGFSLFNKIGWISRVKDGTTIINRTERVTITQDAAYQEAISRLASSVVAVRTERVLSSGKVEVMAEGAGFVLTSDGLIVTANVLLPKGANRALIIRDNNEFQAITIKQDELSGLALLKINENNLPVVALADLVNSRLGDVVFLLGANKAANNYAEFVNLGFIRSLLPSVSVNFSENQIANGSPLVNIKGEVLGLCLIDKNKIISIVTEDKIRELIK